jgi:hypothetical protein
VSRVVSELEREGLMERQANPETSAHPSPRSPRKVVDASAPRHLPTCKQCKITTSRT